MQGIASLTSATAPFLATRRHRDTTASPVETSPFVGRRAELERLTGALADAGQGHGRVAVLAGEAGIGKTRTAEELMREARRRGYHVLFGACYERDDAPAYWPWSQAIRTYVERREPLLVRAEMGPGAGDIAQIVPALHHWLPNLPPSPNLESEQARYRLFQSVTTFLKRAAHNTPLLVVLDDLHSADRPSLLLLEVLAQELRDAHILVLVTFRDNEIEQRYPVAQTLAEVGRHADVLRITLPPLAEEDVARFLALRTGTEPGADVVAALHRQTEGNPLSVTERVQLSLAEGSFPVAMPANHRAVPERVQTVIARRLDRLSESCRTVLSVAALVGREFDVAVLAHVTGIEVDTLLADLDEVVSARIVTAVPGTVGRYRFAHALIRDTLDEPLTPSRRIEFHQRIGEALEAVHASCLGEHAAEIAHHFFYGAVNGGGRRAVEYTLRAADVAMTRLAYEDAAGHYERALAVLASIAPDERERCAVLLALGAAHARAGSTPEARTAFREAATIAARLSDRLQYATAALGFAGPMLMLGLVDRDTVAFLESALAVLQPEDDMLRGRVLGRLAAELSYSGSTERCAELAREATAIGRRIGDMPTLAFALMAGRHTVWGRTGVDDDLPQPPELLARAEGSGDREAALDARMYLLCDLLQRGDISAADREIEEIGREAEALRHPVYSYRALVYRGTRALMEGRFADAERLTHGAIAIGRRVAEHNAMTAFAVQMGTLRRIRGGFKELIEVIQNVARLIPTIVGWRAALAVFKAEHGAEGEARGLFEQLAARDFTDVPKNFIWLPSMGYLSEAAWLLRDAPRAARLYELLLPYADHCILGGFGAEWYGPVTRYLGLLATTTGRFDDAKRHLDDAMEQCKRAGARTYVVLTTYACAVMLFRRRGPGDRASALEMVARARAFAEQLGMTFVARQLDALENDIAGDAPRAPAARYCLRREGDWWTVRGDGPVFRLKDTLGLRCLATLLARPGEELLALQLASLARGGAGLLPAAFTADAGPALDREAKAAYRRRVDELRMSLERADGAGDVERTVVIRRELESVAGELARATGLGGRHRTESSLAERARVNVTRTIRDAIRRITEHDPVLGRVLMGSVRTGTLCRYAPLEPAITWEL